MLRKQISIILIVLYHQSHAEIITDGTLGSRMNLQAPNYDITQDLGKTVGPNLFHSFEQFDIYQGETATFLGSPKIQNVISRVTGGNASTIDGTLRNTIPNADTYLINPHGIMFGANAKLDLQGSFHASTADYLSLGENGRFDASNPNRSLLNVAPVESFGFLSDSPTALSVEGSQLSILPNKTFSLVGGDIHIKHGYLSTPSGQFNLVSIAEQGEIKLSNLETSSFEKQGKITLSEHTELNVNGLGAGKIVIRGGQFVSDNSTIQANTFADQEGKGVDIQLTESASFKGDVLAISNSTFGQGNAGYLVIFAPNLEIVGSVISSGSAGFGTSGNITIEANQVALKAGGVIRSDTYGPGQGGQININATKNLTLEGQRHGSIMLPGGLTLINYPSEISTDAYSVGKAGSLNVTTDELNLVGSFIAATTFGEGQAGYITIQANQATLTEGASISSSSNSNGLSGDLNITVTDTLSVIGKRTGTFSVHFGENTFEYGNNQTVIAVAALGKGHGGTVSIEVPTLILDDSGVIAASTVNEGNAGNIVITTKDLYLTQGGQISNSSGGLMGTQLIIGTGDGGNIHLKATNSITASGFDERGTQSGIISNTLGPGKGGDILIETHQLNLGDHGTVAANSLSTGDAGHITISADVITLTDNGKITTTAQNATGGNITLTAPNRLYLRNAQITTSVHGGAGNGGNINITHPVFIALCKGQIKAQADAGHGGNIFIITDNFLTTSCSVVSASSKLGIDGHVEIDSPDETISKDLIQLSPGLIREQYQFKTCKVQITGERSHFVVQPYTRSGNNPDDLRTSDVNKLFAK